MPNLTEMRHAYGNLERVKAHMAKVKEKGEEAIGQGIQLAEVAGAAGIAGYVNAKFGTDTGNELQIKGVPADLLTGIGLHALAFLGGAGKHATHAHNVADGLVAAYAYRAGVAAAADLANLGKLA
jgi:hypothetical protein